MDFPQATMQPAYTAKEAEGTLLRSVFSWMTGGLLTTAAVTWFVMGNEALLYTIISNQILFWGLVIAELGLVFYLSARINQLSSGAATACFLGYSAANGITLTPLIYVATQSSPGAIGSAFMITAAVFGTMALLGYTTKRDLSSFGSFAIMGVVGIVIASVVNIFLMNSMVSFMISVVAVIAFTLLTAYDVQKIKRLAPAVTQGTLDYKRASIMGALTLYLDVINLFIHILSLLMNRD